MWHGSSPALDLVQFTFSLASGCADVEYSCRATAGMAAGLMFRAAARGALLLSFLCERSRVFFSLTTCHTCYVIGSACFPLVATDDTKPLSDLLPKELPPTILAIATRRHEHLPSHLLPPTLAVTLTALAPQGNVDPMVLFGPPEAIRQSVQQCV